MLSELSKGIFGQTQFIEHWTVLDGIEDNMIVGSVNQYCCSKLIVLRSLTVQNRAHPIDQDEPGPVAAHAHDGYST